jgi:hypothetical protein
MSELGGPPVREGLPRRGALAAVVPTARPAELAQRVSRSEGDQRGWGTSDISSSSYATPNKNDGAGNFFVWQAKYNVRHESALYLEGRYRNEAI